jgi:hypothetical protein
MPPSWIVAEAPRQIAVSALLTAPPAADQAKQELALPIIAEPGMPAKPLLNAVILR